MNETIKDAFYKTLSSCQGGIGGHVLARWHARFGMPLRATLARKFARALNTIYDDFIPCVPFLSQTNFGVNVVSMGSHN